MVCFVGPSQCLSQHALFLIVLCFIKHVPCRAHVSPLSLQLESESHSGELDPHYSTFDFIGYVEYGLKEGFT